MGIIGWIILIVIIVAIIIALAAWWYERATNEVSLLRTGVGGRRGYLARRRALWTVDGAGGVNGLVGTRAIRVAGSARIVGVSAQSS